MTEKKDGKEDDSSVRVALRIRPQLAREKIDMCQVCTSVVPGEPQVTIGNDKSFTFDHVFDIATIQETIYDTCVRKLIDGCFDGYNATVFAYGQTGSGKTYTMGTGFDINTPEEEVGIIPRAVDHLFRGIEQTRRDAIEKSEPPPDFKVNAQFIELYNEEILDLLDTTRDPDSRGRKSHIKIHEDATGGIYVVGVTTKPVSSLEDTIQCLKNGALSRATASTNMNTQSSRSHAIFTLHIKQHRVVRNDSLVEEEKDTDSTQSLNEFETLTAKFHFVDLAGSERLKRTGATGDRAKEGISINCGLLALGNVISALGDKLKKGSHVPYRDSKLTRLLQDSLGGNSMTLMIACISPSDRDFIETLNTLKYANRARNIKNKVTANQDKASKQMAILRAEIQTLQQELLEYKTGKRTVDADGVESVNDMFNENTMLQTENDKLRQRIKALHETIESLTARNTQLLVDKDLVGICNVTEDARNDEVKKLIEGYIKQLEDLRAKLTETEKTAELYRRKATPSRMGTSMSMTGSSLISPLSPTPMSSMSSLSLSTDLRSSTMSVLGSSTLSILDEAKKDIRRGERKIRKKAKNKNQQSSDKENISDNEKDQIEINGNEDQGQGQVIGKKDDDDLDEIMEEDINGELVDDDESDDDEEELENLSSSDDGDSESGDDKGHQTTVDFEEAELEEWLLWADSDNVHEDLAELTCEISIKQRLVEELEQSQRKLHAVKLQYEEKVIQLQERIKATEVERDKVLSNLGSAETQSSEKVKKIKVEYEKKLSGLQTDLRKMQSAMKEHSKLAKNQSHYEKQLKTLQHELAEMKKTKVKLMKQVKEEADKIKASEAKRNKEVAQLKKEQLRKENLIRNLEKEKKQKEVVLKRKQEEVEALRKRDKKPMSSRAAGRIGKYDRPNTIPIAPVPTAPRRRKRSDFNAKQAKQKWDALDRNMNSVIVKKQTISHMEKDMDIWLKQREKLCKKLDKYCRKRDIAIRDRKDDSVIKDLNDIIEGLKTQVQYAQENIAECQVNIMQMEETKDEGDGVDVNGLISTCTLEEAKYLLTHLLDLSLSKGMALSQKEAEVRELQAHLHQTELNNTLQQDLLKHMINDRVDIEVDNLMTNAADEMETSGSSASSSPADRNGCKTVIVCTSNCIQIFNSYFFSKVRRKTPLPQELLYADNSLTPLLPLPETPEEERLASQEQEAPQEEITPGPVIAPPPQRDRPYPKKAPLPDPPPKKPPDPPPGNATTPDSVLMPPPKQPPPNTGLSKVPSSSNLSRIGVGGRADPGPSPSMRRKEFPRPSPEPSPVLRRKNNSATNLLSRSSSIDTATSSDTTPPSSPTLSRRSRDRVVDDNVFSRLTSNTQPPTLQPPNRGTIQPNSGKMPTTKLAPVVCTHTAEGHNKPVLSVDCTEDLLFTSSKDRTAKVWDLQTGRETLSLPGHPNNVVSVRYCQKSRLIFTVSQSYISVWDARNHSKQCVKTLSSSGLTHDGPLNFGSNRQIELAPGEHHINDIALNKDGTVLYSATGSMVRVWDLNSFSAIGKLNGGHQAAIMVLAVDRAGENDIVLTGSKDHYIKMFEVLEERAGVLTPKYNLEPPHYDGIQSMAIQGDMLFSGSRDTCIKKWDLSSQQLVQSVNSAHKDWICGLQFMPSGNILLSGCRGGYLKLWNVENCQPLGEVKAHSSPINALATNSTAIFTASNDHNVGIWSFNQDIPLKEETDEKSNQS
ncbi:hypothetical protein FSP39_019440 [Pinctada imbricata]|uniref:Kinesin motor domain-containing protein n=1 Tax=Pinctada imbricata TaxID=66713 RepID=A0AA88YQ61_PINIB|nr:hypothetical protein FSP39_019440 [Pinctada imbricata]